MMETEAEMEDLMLYRLKKKQKQRDHETYMIKIYKKIKNSR